MLLGNASQDSARLGLYPKSHTSLAEKQCVSKEVSEFTVGKK